MLVALVWFLEFLLSFSFFFFFLFLSSEFGHYVSEIQYHEE